MTKFFTAVSLAIALISLPAHAKSIDEMNLQEVYALDIKTVENFVLGRDGDTCVNLLSVYKVGKDPAKLSPAEFCAVQNYSGAGFLVNGPLWQTDASGSALSGYQWAYVRVLDSALKKIKSEPKTTVYRGTSKYNLAFGKKGDITRLKGYTSTTPDYEVAEGFIGDRLMIIEILNGKNIKNYSNSGTEDELLLPRSTRVKFERSEVKRITVFTEENGPEERDVEHVYLTTVDAQ